MGLKRKPADLASMIMNFGDTDINMSNPQDRIDFLGHCHAEDAARVDSAQTAALTRPATKIAKWERIGQWLVTRRETTNSQKQHQVEQARLWRVANLYERIVGWDLPGPVKAFLGLLLAGTDAYLFANAFTYVNRNDSTLYYTVGALIGLIVYISGTAFANTLKTWSVGRAQRGLLADADATPTKAYIDPDVRPLLTVMRPGGTGIALAGGVFAVLVLAGAAIRYQGAGVGADNNTSLIFMQAIIPLVVVVVEYLIHNPLERHLKGETVAEAFVGSRQASWGREAAAISEQFGHTRVALDEGYAKQHNALSIHMADLNLTPTADGTPPHLRAV